MSPPRVSVIIATRNAARYLPECLDSVIAQTLPAFEIVVVDAASIDATAEIVARYPQARMVQQEGLGFARAWNQGIIAATGDYLAFIDSDDRWLPDKLERQAALLEADPALACAIGCVQFFVQPGQIPPRSWRDRVLAGEHVAQMPGALLARRSVFDAIGMWGEEWRIASDIDWFVKLKDSGLPVGVVDALVLEKRVHGDNLSLVTAGDQVYPDEVLRLLHASIQRKRAAAT